MGYTEYRALYSINVNNYLAVKPEGKTKGKGQFAIGGLAKNPTNTISVKAAISLFDKTNANQRYNFKVSRYTRFCDAQDGTRAAQ